MTRADMGPVVLCHVMPSKQFRGVNAPAGGASGMWRNTLLPGFHCYLLIRIVHVGRL